jgi:serine/threonine protein kinase
VLRQLFNAFQELINKGVVHRDLKPENILINNGVYKLADFGLSE